MIEIKQAVNAAIEHLVKLYDNPPGVQLEEIFRSDDDASWLVTLSFLAPLAEGEWPVGAYGMMRKLTEPHKARKYKTFEVNAETGEVRSMKIRPVPSV